MPCIRHLPCTLAALLAVLSCAVVGPAPVYGESGYSLAKVPLAPRDSIERSDAAPEAPELADLSSAKRASEWHYDNHLRPAQSTQQPSVASAGPENRSGQNTFRAARSDSSVRRSQTSFVEPASASRISYRDPGDRDSKAATRANSVQQASSGSRHPVFAEGELLDEAGVMPEQIEFIEAPRYGRSAVNQGPTTTGHDHGCGGCSGDGGCSMCYEWCWWHELSIFAGTHAFDGPVPANRSGDGNFGFNEGINWGSPFWHAMEIGYQLGVQALQSNFAGEDDAFDDSRNQFFLTTGFYHRASFDRGIQGGIVYDWLHDDYFSDEDFGQIRGELSYRLRCDHELGFGFATNVQGEGLTADLAPVSTADMYSIFYRKTFASGGAARVWLGFSNGRDGLVGADTTLPITQTWSLDGSLNYLLPDETEVSEDTWSLGINLVWTPGGRGRGDGVGQFRPLFNVADNSTMMLKRLDRE